MRPPRRRRTLLHGRRPVSKVFRIIDRAVLLLGPSLLTSSRRLSLATISTVKLWWHGAVESLLRVDVTSSSSHVTSRDGVIGAERGTANVLEPIWVLVAELLVVHLSLATAVGSLWRRRKRLLLAV
jgi:hypothetical protein